MKIVNNSYDKTIYNYILRSTNEEMPGRRVYLRVEKFIFRLQQVDLEKYFTAEDREEVKQSIEQYIANVRDEQKLIMNGECNKVVSIHSPIYFGIVDSSLQANKLTRLLCEVFEKKFNYFDKLWGSWDMINPLKVRRDYGRQRFVSVEKRKWSGRDKAVVEVRYVLEPVGRASCWLNYDPFVGSEELRLRYLELLKGL